MPRGRGVIDAVEILTVWTPGGAARTYLGDSATPIRTRFNPDQKWPYGNASHFGLRQFETKDKLALLEAGDAIPSDDSN